jgi:hypothetical protein
VTDRETDRQILADRQRDKQADTSDRQRDTSRQTEIQSGRYKQTSKTPIICCYIILYEKSLIKAHCNVESMAIASISLWKQKEVPAIRRDPFSVMSGCLN